MLEHCVAIKCRPLLTVTIWLLTVAIWLLTVTIWLLAVTSWLLTATIPKPTHSAANSIDTSVATHSDFCA